MKYITPTSKKLHFLLAIGFAVVVGGATTAVGSAAIPDSSAAIHACYRTTASSTDPQGGVRVIDPSAGQNCDSDEAPLNWGASNHQIAYAAFNNDNTLNTAYSSSEVVDAALVDYSGAGDYAACFHLSFTPKAMYGLGSAGGQGFFVSGFDPQSQITATCGAGYNAMASTAVSGDTQAAYVFSN